MHFIPLYKAKPGMVVAKEILDSSNRVLIGQNMVLNENYINGLKNYGFSGIYISDSLTEGIEIENAISPQLQVEGIECVKSGDLDRCKNISRKIVEELIEKGGATFDLIDLRDYNDQTFSHSVNVAVLCCAMGMAMELRRDELESLVYAALLHDLGKLKVPEEILNKPDKLTSEEYEIIKGHPVYSYDIIKERLDISIDVKLAVLYHHENVDGSGYPVGLTADDMSIYTKILHVADVYDAMTSKRPYKNPYSAYEACEYLMGGCGIMFDRDVVSILVKSVPMYPKGTEITLSTGQEAVILENSDIHNLRPVVITLEGEKIDLSERNYLDIGIIPPSHEQMDDPSVDKMNTGLAKSKPLIYVVDDMVTNIALLEEILEEKYEVKSYISGLDMVNDLNMSNPPSVILMDIDMPALNGIETAKLVNGRTNCAIPILFVSALSDVGTVLAVREIDAAGYVLRPYNDIYILGEIDRVINRWG